MTIVHSGGSRPFQPSGKGGGSKKGKPQAGRWPWVIKIVADALFIRAKGTAEAWTVDRASHLSHAEFGQQMEAFLPGWQEHIEATMPGRATDRVLLLYNRVYKMHYSGTSDRQAPHNPRTRATQSREHWLRHIPTNHPLRLIHEQVARGQVSHIPNWQEYLGQDQERLF